MSNCKFENRFCLYVYRIFYIWKYSSKLLWNLRGYGKSRGDMNVFVWIFQLSVIGFQKKVKENFSETAGPMDMAPLIYLPGHDWSNKINKAFDVNFDFLRHSKCKFFHKRRIFLRSGYFVKNRVFDHSSEYYLYLFIVTVRNNNLISIWVWPKCMQKNLPHRWIHLFGGLPADRLRDQENPNFFKNESLIIKVP